MIAEPQWKRARLTSWGRLATAVVDVAEPRDATETSRLLGADRNRLIAFGSGRSYGDQALLDGGRAVLTRRLQSRMEFDAATGELACGAGVPLRDIGRQFLPQGWMLPVSPGTAFVTVGGAIANDVHGKNHDRVGSFCDHVNWCDLVLPDGNLVRISPTEHPRIFAATVGGSGLTGIIVRAGLRLVRVPSNAVVVREERVANLEALLARFAQIRDSATYSVAWIDAFARGPALGRGVLEIGEPASEGMPVRRGHALAMPCDLPGFALNSWTMRSFNEWYFRRIPADGRERRAEISKFLHPLDAISGWNRIYGRRGFFQFQCVIPDDAAPAGLASLLRTIAGSRAGSFLAVLKTLGSAGQGMLSFPMRGYTLALDFPNRPGVRELLAELEGITLEHAGRVYLAKDSVLSAGAYRRMYPRHGEFGRLLGEIDPEARMTSDMAVRLGLHEARRTTRTAE